MSTSAISALKNVKNFESLINYLRDELNWPIEAENAEDITFDYTPEDLGIEEQYLAKIKTIKQIRPLTDNQPWGLFYIDFETKKLPVVVLRRILKALIYSNRKRNDRMKSWDLHDMIFISSLGEVENRQISFAHFSEISDGLSELRTVSWDTMDTRLHYEQSKIDLEKLRWPDDEGNADAWRKQWSTAFRLKHREVIRTSQQLATAMARLASQIRNQVQDVFEYEIKNGPLHRLYKNFKQVLIHDLTIDSFADMYAQTIAYGLFSARASHEGDFEVEDISALIPNTNPFLKNLFEECTRLGDSVSDYLDLEELGVAKLIQLLKKSNIEAVLRDFGRQKKGEDPVIHFYEDFLREYDSHQKVKRGVFYTPDPVVSFIVRSVDHILRTEFDCPDGLADTSTTKIKYKRKSKKGNNLVEDTKDVPKVQLLDPATGTGTFLKYVIKEIKKTFDEKNKELTKEKLKEKWSEYVPKHLLPRIFGFELMAAPYAVAHLKLGLELAETGYDFKSKNRLNVFLTNTLEGTHKGAGTLDAYFNWLAEEGHKANVIKANYPISVVIGNPPYSGHSANESPWIADLLRGKIKDKSKRANYFEVDGKPLGERNPKWLNDDYVKFIRFGQWRIDKTGRGILAFITNHGYLDNPTFRGMRQQLMESFTDIYVLDLHGNSKKKEKCPDGSKDENVFDIKPGVAIGIFIKNPKKKEQTNIFHCDRFGLRKSKYKELLENRLDRIDFKKIDPISPFYLFIPQNNELFIEYKSGWKITDAIPLNVLGFQSHRDNFAIAFTKENMKTRLDDFRNLNYSDSYLCEKYNLRDSSDWKISMSRKSLQEDKNWTKKLVKCQYRPFDKRWCYLSKEIMDRPRKELITHVARKDNLCLGIGRQGIAVQDPIWSLIVVSDVPIDANVFRRGGVNVFPLYLYPNNNESAKKKSVNINQKFIGDIERKLGLKYDIDSEGDFVNTFGPRDLFFYIYGYLFSSSYRIRYADFLKIDFPWIHITTNNDLFKEIVKFGEELTSIHQMNSATLCNYITSFNGEGNNEIESIGKKSYKNGRMYINKFQYFDGIPEDVYNFHIGGYRVCQKWLKDRKGRILTDEEIEHYQKIIVAINETIRVMKQIDEVIEKHGGWPIK